MNTELLFVSNRGWCCFHSESRIYLKVPYQEKELAKDYGSRWDSDHKMWFINNYQPVGDFRHWFLDDFEDVYPFDYSYDEYPEWVRPFCLDNPPDKNTERFLNNICDHAHKYKTLKRERLIDWWCDLPLDSKEKFSRVPIDKINIFLRKTRRNNFLIGSD